MRVVERDGFFIHTSPWSAQRRDRLEQIPGAFIVVRRQHAATAQGVAVVGIAAAVQAAAGNRRGFQDRDLASGNAAVADHERRGGKGTDAAANQVGLRIVIHKYERDGYLSGSARHRLKSSNHRQAGANCPNVE